MESILTKSQKFTRHIDLMIDDSPCVLEVHVRYDDQCGNGHNSFAITGTFYERDRQPGERPIKHVGTGKNVWPSTCGCIHDLIAEHAPGLAKYIKWHLCGSDGPMHYIENSKYWAGKRGWRDGKKDSPPNLEHFRSTAVWPEATQKDMKDVTEQILQARLGDLMAGFKAAVEELGFVY